MSDVLDKARSIERDCSSSTHLTIRLALLQDLIREIERLQADRPGPLRAVKDVASQRANDQQKGPL